MAKDKTILDRLGWEVLDTIGERGQAKIDLVRRKDQPDSPNYALKKVHTETGKQSYDRFHREIEAIKKIDHPGVVKVVDHGCDEAEGLHFYVMEYIEGDRSLKKIVGTAENPFIADPIKSMSIYLRILEALQACEAAHVVHRDLSLGNVLVSADNQNVKLIDFGCCFIEDGNCITLTDEAVGTPDYRAPECENPASEPTIQADLYSAGKILWSIITNKKAFSREKPVFNDKSMNREMPNDPMTWHLHHIFERTIRHLPGNRYPNVAEALQHSHQILDCIRFGYPPLEKLDLYSRCPICGIGKLHDSRYLVQNTLVTYLRDKMGVPDEDLQRQLVENGYLKDRAVCRYCGFFFDGSTLIRERNLNYRQTLE